MVVGGAPFETVVLSVKISCRISSEGKVMGKVRPNGYVWCTAPTTPKESILMQNTSDSPLPKIFWTDVKFG